jgi:environmental stress-induced protein Ves
MTVFGYPGDLQADIATKTQVWDRINTALAGLETMLTKLRGVHVKVCSPDQRIALELDHAGHLTSVTLADDVTSAYTADELSQRFNDMLARAAEAATAQHHQIAGSEPLDDAIAALADPTSEIWR